MTPTRHDSIVVAQGGTIMAIQGETPTALGKAESEETVKANLECYRELALELGASEAAIIPAGDVIIDERVRLKCVVPRCLRAGETPNCPPWATTMES